MVKFGENLKNTRKSIGLTQDALGETSGVSAKYIGELERAEASPSLDVIEKLAKGLKIDVLLLIGDDANRLTDAQVRTEIVNGLAALDEKQLRQVLRIVRLASGT